MTDEFPEYRGQLEYHCLDCGKLSGIDSLLYTCPECSGTLLLRDKNFDALKKLSGAQWRDIFDRRAAEKSILGRGIFRFYELMAPVLEKEDLLYLGEGNTPEVEAGKELSEAVGLRFAYKNDGQNPSASFKDRGMACAFSYLKSLARAKGWDEVLTICASTGDTSAAAALYASYVGPPLRSVVLLPQGKVTAQQLAQPLGSGATVIELPGVFDDCMKVVEYLSKHYRVALLNSKNAWRILGQESCAYEIAQWHDWRMRGLCVFVPIGNAGNITAVLNGFLKLHALGIIEHLPRIFGVQSAHADPVYRYYRSEKTAVFAPVRVRASVAQAAMIGNPVSFPRVRVLAERYRRLAGEKSFQVIQVSEQAIMDSMLQANRHGHIACTQGGESLAGLKAALALKLISRSEYAILDSTAHMLKFADFQNRYFMDAFDPEYEVKAEQRLVNAPLSLFSQSQKETWSEEEYIKIAGRGIAGQLGLRER
ncbi:MAG: threonine synthase [Deltaproteobacteria bacterium]|jgi:threonine synthase|nr:threonine synthase [Deltaproteobacteria bacterium]